MKFKILCLAAASLFFSCQNNKSSKAEETARKYFDVYSARKDYNQMKSFYNDSVEYENVIQNTSLIKFETNYLLNTLFAFNDKQLVYENGQMFKVNDVISNDTLAIVNGEFNSYTFNGFTFAPMKFTTYLYFDQDFKIKKQVDWFNYPIGDLIELYQLEQQKGINTTQNDSIQ